MDAIYRAFLQTASEDAETVNRRSDVVRLIGRPGSGNPPSGYLGVFTGIEHFERGPGGRIQVSTEPIPFGVTFPPNYCADPDPHLQFEVCRIGGLFHPNVKGSLVCLGAQFRPSTRLRQVVLQLYLIASAQVRAPDHAFSAEARRFYLDHAQEVEKLRAPELWSRPVASAIRLST
ncbi:MAG: hypothetical protein V3T14_00435 [Myxococcota bacterium]